ncbi:MAG: cupredoxin domain-containing protein [Magnetococcales bacterium]|nr:cupredoxin domain-containing protein [Magnetococcales bacterium]
MSRILMAAAALLLTAATPAVHAADDYVTNADEIVKAADWAKAEVVTLKLDEHSYSPNKVTLKAGQPYKLVLKDEGEEKHYFTAPEFFKAIATRKVEVGLAEIKAPYFKAFELKPKGELTLFFVAVTKGTYTPYCSIEDHRKKGMEATIVIE